MIRPGWAISTWAISTGEGKGHLIGLGWFSEPGDIEPAYRAGCRIALFGTRDMARQYLQCVRGPADRGRFPRARVVRVELRITEVGR